MGTRKRGAEATKHAIGEESPRGSYQLGHKGTFLRTTIPVPPVGTEVNRTSRGEHFPRICADFPPAPVLGNCLLLFSYLSVEGHTNAALVASHYLNCADEKWAEPRCKPGALRRARAYAYDRGRFLPRRDRAAAWCKRAREAPSLAVRTVCSSLWLNRSIASA